MVVLPNKFIFLATPRTGSRATSAALMQVEGAKEHRQHHVHPDDIETSAESLVEGSSTLPRFTVIRDPYTQTLSMFYHLVVRHLDRKPVESDILRFVEDIHSSWWFDDRLYPYHAACDKAFLYDPDLQFTMAWMADTADLFPCPVVMRVTDTPTPDAGLLTEQTRAAIERRFPHDVDYFYSMLELDD